MKNGSARVAQTLTFSEVKMYDLVANQLHSNELCPIQPKSMRQMVKGRIEELTEQLEKQKELLQLLEKNPDFERMLTLIR